MGTIGDFRAKFAAAHLKAVNEALNEAKVSNTALDAAIKAKGKEKAYAFFQKAMNDAGPAIAKDVFAKLNGLVAGDIVDFVEI